MNRERTCIADCYLSEEMRAALPGIPLLAP